jgi:hypothetical protein
MKQLSTTIVAIGAVLAIATVACEVFSIAAFYGFGAEAWPVCGSACEVWPGIPTGDACILTCVIRGGAYFPLFYTGMVTGSAAVCVIIAGFVLKRRVAPTPAPARE